MPLYLCRHCQTQNFYNRARVRLASKVPLECWRCRKEVKEQKVQKTPKKPRDKGEPGR